MPYKFNPFVGNFDNTGIDTGLQNVVEDLTPELGGPLDTNGHYITHQELSADPPDPPEGASVMWHSDGTESGSRGDILMKITSNGETKLVYIVDFSIISNTFITKENDEFILLEIGDLILAE